MSAERRPVPGGRMRQAVAELEGLIRERYPAAQFRVSPSEEDPAIVHLTAVVDVEDTDSILDVVIDRMMELQIEDGLPLFVIPVRPPQRVAALRQAGAFGRPRALEPVAAPAAPSKP